MLTACVSGSVFASPSCAQIIAATSFLAQNGNPILYVVKNYTGDVLNFGLALQKARSAGIAADMVIVGDDVAVKASQIGLVGRRGLAGTILVHKVAGAVAQNGLDFYLIIEALWQK